MYDDVELQQAMTSFRDDDSGHASDRACQVSKQSSLISYADTCHSYINLLRNSLFKSFLNAQVHNQGQNGYSGRQVMQTINYIL
jgi:hypothetical protein